MSRMTKWALIFNGLFFLGCIEQESTRSDGSIVVIGNGSSPSTWSKTIVADVEIHVPVVDQSVNRVEQSFILGEGTKVQVASSVSWIMPTTTGDEAVIKFKKLESECGVMRADLRTFVCDQALDSLELSDRFQPSYLEANRFVYVDKSSSLFLSNHGAQILIDSDIEDFFVDASESIFWKKKGEPWNLARFDGQVITVDRAWIPRSAIAYLSKTNDVFVFASEKYEARDMTGAPIALDAKTFYRYESTNHTFKKLWKLADAQIKLDSRYDRIDVLHDSLVVTSSISMGESKSKTKSIYLMGPSGIIEFPGIMKDLVDVDISVGLENIFIRPESDNLSLIGMICSVVKRDPSLMMAAKPAIHCRTLMLPDGITFLGAALANDDLVVGVSRPGAGSSLKYEVFGLDSAMSGTHFGKISRSWEFENKVTRLRYFDASPPVRDRALEIVPEEKSAAKVGQTDFGS